MTIAVDAARVRQARVAAIGLETLAEARAGSRMLTAADIASMVRAAVAVQQACDALDRLVTAADEAAGMIRHLPEIVHAQVPAQVIALLAMARQTYPFLFTDYAELRQVAAILWPAETAEAPTSEQEASDAQP